MRLYHTTDAAESILRDGFRDGQQCLNCKVAARNGAIVHGPTCPEYGSVSGRAPLRAGAVRTTTPHPLSQETPQEAQRRFQRFVGMLQPGRHGRYGCPACGAPGDGRGLKVDFDGRLIRFHCFSCGGAEVLRALRLHRSWLTGQER